MSNNGKGQGQEQGQFDTPTYRDGVEITPPHADKVSRRVLARLLILNLTQLTFLPTGITPSELL
jgi:hypothetical protein